MSSNVQCIGLLADDSKSFEALLAPLANASVEDVPGHFLWTDPSGASIAFHLSEARTLACITPFFAPRGRAAHPLARAHHGADPRSGL